MNAQTGVPSGKIYLTNGHRYYYCYASYKRYTDCTPNRDVYFYNCFEFTYEGETEPPIVSLTNKKEGWTNQGKIGWSATDASGISSTLLNDQVVVAPAERNINLNGMYVLKATDINGNVATTTLEVKNIDILKPKVTLLIG